MSGEDTTDRFHQVGYSFLFVPALSEHVLRQGYRFLAINVILIEQLKSIKHFYELKLTVSENTKTKLRRSSFPQKQDPLNVGA